MTTREMQAAAPQDGADSPLAKELEVFENHREELVAKADGTYVLIRGDELGGVFDDEMEAIHHGWQRYGAVPFLVKRVAAVDEPVTFTRMVGI